MEPEISAEKQEGEGMEKKLKNKTPLIFFFLLIANIVLRI